MMRSKFITMKMRRIDHVVLPVSDLARSERFYHEVFDMPVLDQQSGPGVVTLRCGHQLIRLVKAESPRPLAAKNPQVGGADLCLVAGDAVDSIVHHLRSYFIDLVAGPRTELGAEGEYTALYLRDPDQNLIEIAVYRDR